MFPRRENSNIGRGVFYEVRAEVLYPGPVNIPHVEAGSNTSTVALQVVGGDEKKTQCLGV
jgi:hypothetical protein